MTRWGALLLVIGVSLGFAAPLHATPASPNDPAFKLQWNLQMIGAPSAWQVATGSGSTIAIVDTQEQLMLTRVKFQNQLSELHLTDATASLSKR